MTEKIGTWLVLIVLLLWVTLGSYSAIAWTMFQYNNPTANRMAYWRNFAEVHRFEVLPEYQTR